MTVAITGAGGFIGQRLAQRLHFTDGYAVRGLVHRNGPKLARFARLPVDVTIGNILNQETVDGLLADADVVVHCAHGDRETTVMGTRRVLEAAADADLDQVIHLSTYVVHGWDPGVVTLDENTPIDPDDEPYSKWKAAAERLVWEYHDQAEISLTVFRPGIVYGPHGVWSTRPIRELREGLVLADDGQGIANVVYVDNLIDALCRSIGSPDADGECFLIADNDHPTWREYYRGYADLLPDCPPIRSVRRETLGVRRRKRQAVESVAPLGRIAELLTTRTFDATVKSGETRQELKRELGRLPWGMYLYHRLPDGIQETVRATLSGDSRSATALTGNESYTAQADSTGAPEYPLPAPYEADLYTSTTKIDTDKLESTLDWTQSVGHERGMAFTGAWLDYAGEIDD